MVEQEISTTKVLFCSDQYFGQPLEVFNGLTEHYNVGTVFTNSDYEPYAKKRDTEIAAFLETKGIKLKAFKDHVIFEKDDVVKSDGKPYLASCVRAGNCVHHQ